MAKCTRREFVSGVAGLMGYGLLTPGCVLPNPSRLGEPPFRISLAQWSLHRALQSGALHSLDFPREARRLGFRGVEYVNQFFMHQAKDFGYLGALRRRCEDAGVESILIMCDGEGHLGAPEDGERSQAIDNHRKWIDAAAFLGCHAIRVNARSSGPKEVQQHLAADGLRRLAEIGAEQGISVIVENHGGWSSDGAWLAAVMQEVDHPGCGTLPDFGNFRVEEGHWYDRYRGVEEMMPFAKAVSAKSHDFHDDGQEAHTDYFRMLRIVLDSGYRGWIGVEYEGASLSEEEGILATRRLLEAVREELMQPSPRKG